MTLKKEGVPTCFTTVTVPGATATTEATAAASWLSAPSPMICCRMFTAVGSSRSPYEGEANDTIQATECETSPWQRPL